MRLEVFARGLVNGWGHVFDRWGQSFLTDGAGGEGINYAFPGAAFTTAVDVQRILRGLNPGQPKHCGIEILSGRHVPPEMQGHVITNDFRGNRINHFALNESGSGYVSKQADDLLRARHVAFRPVDIKQGPDGAIYVADFYNPIIQHGEVDFRDPRRDHTHGRIWRITAKGRPTVKPPQLVGAPVAQLLEALKQPEDWTREQARREFQERGARVALPALEKWLDENDHSGRISEDHRLELLWALRSIDAPTELLLTRLLSPLISSENHRVRAVAVRVLSEWHGEYKPGGSRLLNAIDDPHPKSGWRPSTPCENSTTPRRLELRCAHWIGQWMNSSITLSG